MDEPKSVAEIRLLGGHPSLDFVNTVDAWRDRWGPDCLQTYADLTAWAERVGLIDKDHAERLRSKARADPPGAEEALLRAKALREVLHAVFLAEAEDQAPQTSVADVLKSIALEASLHRVLTYEVEGFSWCWVDADDLDGIGHRIALAAADLLIEHTRRRRVRECRGPNCGWLFLDKSRGGKRIWCSDETCGSLVRVLRFRGKYR
jgi:predicted RNA-binding Zn ribbon-like protein